MNLGQVWSRFRRLPSLLRPGSFDLDTEAGRSHERYRRAALASGASLLARVLAVVTLFVAIRVVAHNSSSEALGLWLLLVTAVTLVGFADLGIGNGLLNVIADAEGRDDHDLTREAISSAFLALGGVALVGGALFAVIYPHVSWATLFNVTGPAAGQAGPATAAFVACTLISLPLGIAQRVNLAHQRGWIANAWQGVGSLLSLVAVVVAATAHAGTGVLVAAMLGGLPLAYLVDSAVLFWWSRPDLRPRLATATVSAARRVMSHGLLFFVLATVVAVSYESDTFVIAHFLGADQVQDYAVPFRLFMLAPSAIALIITPLWPAYGEAVARRDLAWVHQTLRRSLLTGLVLAGIPSLLLIPLAQPIIDIWVRGAANPPVGLLVALAIWATMNGISTALATFFNGAGILRLQVGLAVVMGVANLALSIVLVQHLGVAGPIWGTVITQALLGLLPGWFILRGLFRAQGDPEAVQRWLHRWSDHPERHLDDPDPAVLAEAHE